LKKILILGSSGFIGKNISKFFGKEKFFLYGTYFKNKPKKNSKIKFIKADLTKKNQAKKALKGIDIVIQAAAVTGGIKDTKKNITKYIADNVIMNSSVLESVFENKVKHFIFLSCTVMYPSNKKPLKENDFDANGNIYQSYLGVAWNKVYIEKICEFYSKISKTKFTILRHSNVFGPYDTFDLNKSHVCAATIKKVFDSNTNKIKVWGNGREGRDLLFVYDLVEAIRLSIKNQKNNYEIFNIGSGKLISSSGYDFFESITREHWSHDYNRMVDSLSRILSDDKKLSFTEAKKIVSDLMKERLKNGFLKKSARNKDKMKSKNVIHSYLTHILLDKTGLRPIREFIRTKNSMRLWTSKDSRFHSDFLPIENSLTGKGLRNDEI